MCGKFTRKYTWKQLHRLYSLFSVPVTELSGTDVVPSQMTPVVRQGAQGREAVMMKWGFVPAWSKDPGVSYSTINARSEEVSTKATYRTALAQRQRCIIPVSSFYEPERIPGQKKNNQWRFSITDEPIMSIAGLWDRWEKDGSVLESFTLLTCAPNAAVGAVHDRMPCIVPPHLVGAWLDPGVPEVPGALAPSAQPFEAEKVFDGGFSSPGPMLFG